MSTTFPTPLASEISGRVITPADPEYDELRKVKLGGVDARPAAIVRVASAEDVARANRHARDAGLELAVRSGGHSGAGHGTVDGGLVIDVRDMNAIEIDPEGRTAWVGSGATAAEVTTAAAEHGLAVGFGDTGSVGVGGLTLGGGIGFLVRKYGLTIDSVIGAEIVTADGDVLQIDEDSHPDLFWAIRGGGGNFGVVTRFRYRLHPLDGVVGGIMVLPATAEVLAGFIAAAEAAPEEMSTIANVMPCPPMPFVAEEHHGTKVILAFLCYAGDADAGEAAMAPFRALAEPLADLVKPISYPEMYMPEPEPEGPAPTFVGVSFFLDRVDLPVARTLMKALDGTPEEMRMTQLRVLGGAMARVPADATAFAHRSSRIMGIVVGMYDGPEQLAVRHAWANETVAGIRQSDSGVYVNFLDDEGLERIRAAYPGPTWDRLLEVKQRYDPTNLFRRNQNVRPA